MLTPESKKSEGTARVGKREYKETVLLFIKMLVTIFLCEAAIMALLHVLPLKSGWKVIADPVLLTLLGTPILYWLLVRPVWHSLKQRTLAVEALGKEKDKAQMYLDIVGVILVVLDSEGNVTLINRKGSEILGCNEVEIIGRNWFDNFVPAAERKHAEACFEELMTGNTASLEYFESLVLTKNREEKIIKWHVVVLRDEDGNAVGMLSSGEDITERKRMEEDLRKHHSHLEELIQARTAELIKTNKQLLEEIERRKGLEKELLNIIERERQRIGQELHDSIGQQLTGIEFMMEVLAEKLTERSLSEEVPYAEKINSLVGETAEQTRNLAKGLHPIDLDRNGLVSALHELTANTEQLFEVSCTLKCEKAASINDVSVAINLYRIAQEAITNAIKHGKAKKIRIDLTSKNDGLTLTVENDGLDFPEELSHGEGMGLKIMRYRAEIINSSLDIYKGTNGGTIVTCVLPNEENL